MKDCRYLHGRAPLMAAMARVKDRLADNKLPAIHRLVEDMAEAVPLAEGGRDPQTALVEAVLFIASEALPARKIAKAANLADAAEARKILQRLRWLYDQDGSAFQVEEIAGGFQLLTRSDYHRWLVRLQPAKEHKLSSAARETLAIVAYRQPLMRAEIEGIRGVQCGEILRQLMERGLIRIVGRDNSLGRPVLYGTTKTFLQIFGLKSLKDLPENPQLSNGHTTEQSSDSKDEV